MPDINVTNIYQLIAFLIVAGLQIYTRWEVGQLAKKQDVANARHDAERGSLLRLANHATGLTAGHLVVSRAEAKASLEGALRVAYYQGQVDVAKDRPFPEERVKAAVEKLIEIIEHAGGNGEDTVSESTAKAAEQMVKVTLEARNGAKPGSPPIEH